MTVPEHACPACGTSLPPEAQFCMRCGSGTLAGRYTIERMLGEGGMATVYLAEDLKHHRKVAVKVMRGELAATLGADRFLREVEIAARLSHPHVLPLFDSGEAQGMLYYVMPYVEGESLRDRLQREGPLPVDEAVRFAREIAGALAYAHERGVIHRDIKPANILISAGHALVADFGIARAIGADSGEVLTRTGLAVGTPHYMAPEQATAEREVDGRADVYATGAVLYEMLAGEPPFTGPNARTILTRSLTETPRSLVNVRAGLPRAVDAAVQKALAKEPSDRYESATAFAEALAAARSTPVATRSSGNFRRLATPRTAIIGVLIALTVGATSAILFARRGAAAASATTTHDRIAVLPFQNQGTANDDYIVDGIADEVRGKLAQVSGLAVIATASASQYKGTTKTPQEIGKELGVNYLLVGKVRWANTAAGARRVQVVPVLIDAKSGEMKWQQTFDTDITDVFAVQSSIATRVAGALGVELASTEQQQVAKRPTDNVQAYQLYLKGRAMAGIDPASLRSAAVVYEQAVTLDSTFADAWAALSMTVARLYANGETSPENAQRARQALDRTVKLDPNGPQTHLAASRYYFLIPKDNARARSEIDLALRAAPNDVEILAFAAALDVDSGDLGSGLTRLERARDLDPRSFGTLRRLSQAYAGLGRATDAEATAEAALMLHPGDIAGVQWMAIANVLLGKLDGARAVVRSAVESGVPAPSLAAQFAGYYESSWILDDRERQLVFRLTPSAFDGDRAWWSQSLATAYWEEGDATHARAYADSGLALTAAQSRAAPRDCQLGALYALMLSYLGRAPEARAEVARVVDVDPGKVTNLAYCLVVAARTELVLGGNEKALDYLEQMRQLGFFTNGEWLRLDPTFRALQGNPRFERLLKSD